MSARKLKRINTTRVVAVSLILVAVAGIGTLFYQRAAVKAARDNAYASLANTVEGQADSVETMLAGKFELLEAFADAIDPLTDSRENIAARMDAVAKAAGFARLLFSDLEGAAYFSDGSQADISGRQYFADALAGERAIETLESDLVESIPMMLMSVPVVKDGAVVGVVAGGFEEQAFTRTVFLGISLSSSFSVICEPNGDVILASERGDAVRPEGDNVLAILREVKLTHTDSAAGVASDFAEGRSGVMAYSYEGQQRYAVYEPLGVNDWMVFSVLHDQTVMNSARSLVWSGYALTASVVLAALVMLYYIIYNQRRYSKQLDLYRSMEQSGVFSMALDEELTILYANDRFYQMFGYTKSELRERLDNRCLRCIHPADADSVTGALRSLREAGGGYTSWVMRILTGEGELKYFMMSGVADCSGEECVFNGVAVDITEQKKGEAQLAALYRRELSYRKAMEPNFHSTALYNISRRVQVDMSSRHTADEMRPGMSLEEYARAAATDVVENEDARLYFQTLSSEALERRAGKTDEPVAFDYKKRMPDGTGRWMHYEAHLLREPDSGDLMAFLYLTDVDEQKTMVLELEEAARTDSMTGLLNHDAVFKEIKRYLSMEGAGGVHALFMIDLDNFKQANDRLGHQRGDLILAEAAAAIASCFRVTDVVGRVGGDEFMVLMKNAFSNARVQRKAQELLQSLQLSCRTEAGAEPLLISGSLGVAMCRDEGKSFEQLYSEADSALYRAKNAGRGRYCFAGVGEGERTEAEPIEGAQAVRLQTLLEYMDGGVVMARVGEEIETIYVSPSFMRTFNRTPDEIGPDGQAVLKMVLPEDEPAFLAAIKSSASRDGPVDHYYRVRESDGSIGWRHMRAARVPAEADERATVVAVISDMTELKASQIQLSAIVGNAPVGLAIYEVDAKGARARYVNDYLVELTGMTREEYLAKILPDAMALFHPDDLPMVKAAVSQAALDGKPHDVIYRTNKEFLGDEKERIMLARGVRMTMEDDKAILLVMFIDITERSEMEAEIRETNERLRSAFEQTGLSLWEVDVPNRSLGVWDMENRRYYPETVFENLPESLTETGWIHPEYKAEYTRFLNSLLDGRDSGELACIVRYLGGEDYGWANMSYRMIRDERGNPKKAIGVMKYLPYIFNEQERLKAAADYQQAAASSVYSTARVDLSADRLEYFTLEGAEMTERAGASYSLFHEEMKESVYGEADRRRYAETLSPSAMAEAYRGGVSTFSLEFRRSMGEGRTLWMTCAVELMTNPVSGALMAFTFTRVTERRKYLELRTHVKAERDPDSYLFTKAAARAIAETDLAQPREGKACALAMVKVRGLDSLAERFGVGAQSRALGELGRQALIMLDGPCVLGRESVDVVSVYLPGAESPEQAKAELTRLLSQMKSTGRLMLPHSSLIARFAVAALSYDEADYQSLRQKALDALDMELKT